MTATAAQPPALAATGLHPRPGRQRRAARKGNLTLLPPSSPPHTPRPSAAPFHPCRALVSAIKIAKFVKSKKVVQVMTKHYSEHKSVIVKNIHDNTLDHHYSFALVTRIDSYPHKMTTIIGKKKISKWSKINSFVKVYKNNYFMPTRYSVNIPLDKTMLNKDDCRIPALKCKAKKEATVKFEKRYKTGKNKWFFQKLCFQMYPMKGLLKALDPQQLQMFVTTSKKHAIGPATWFLVGNNFL
ncbi:60S ribosomal protein L27-like [Sorex araneus]|uniref:60S ribosomal protein L27-like n=1 Tax=Sorex araneus TaxID=42254 RepID=UPI00243382B0|nr:60S ribosomal protein L27-like [Sorex araneus]